jgi:tetratricopeptide (TPR) repeat protein
VSRGESDSAIKKFEDTLAANPDNQAAYFSLCQLYELTKNYQKAIETYEKLVQKKPELWSAVNNLAFLLTDHGRSPKDLERALELAKKAYAANPQNAYILDTLGWIYYRTEDMKQGLEFMERAYMLDPESTGINYHLGMALHKLGRTEEAREHLAKALASKDDFFGRDAAEVLMQ